MILRILLIILMLPMAALAQSSKSLPELETATGATGDDLLMIYDYGAVGTKTRHITAANLRTYMGGGSGTVTSVSLTAPDIFTVSGSGGTTAVSLVIAPTDPAADRLVFWDDSAGKWVYLTPGSGLLITGTTLGFDINGLTADASPDSATDYVITYDASAGTVKKVLLSDLPGGGGGSVATDAIWDAQGDLALGSGANTSVRLPRGADGTFLVSSPLAVYGVEWQAPSAFETLLEAVLDLQDLQGAVTDGQVPDNITVNVATLASTVTVIDGTDSTSFPLIVDSATGSLAPKTDAGLTYDATTGKLTSTILASGGSGAGSVELADADESHAVTLKAHPTTTSSYNLLAPAAGFTGFMQYTLTGSDMQASQFTGGAGLLGMDGSNVPVHVSNETELETALGGIDILVSGEVADVDDTAVAASWNANLDATTKNALHDYFALMDSDLDGLVNALDATFTFSGFSISGDGDGAITLLGAGDGADEDLTINLDDTANNAVVTTSTGLTNITLTAINLTVPAAAYDATAWNGNNTAPTRDDVRDKVEDIIDGQVWTGVHDFGGATSTEIVNGNNPTVDAAGEIAVDSNDNSIRIYGAAARVIPTIYTATVTIYDPDGIQSVSDALPILAVESTWAPGGITIVDIYLKTDSSSSYSIDLEEWTSPTDGAPSTIETVATSSTTEAEDDGTLTDASIAAGSIVFIDLPATSANWIQVSFTYTINSNN